ncbi:hypothetical protein Trydic_g23219 [Trypoxylus dichotomus]
MRQRKVGASRFRRETAKRGGARGYGRRYRRRSYTDLAHPPGYHRNERQQFNIDTRRLRNEEPFALSGSSCSSDRRGGLEVIQAKAPEEVRDVEDEDMEPGIAEEV